MMRLKSRRTDEQRVSKKYDCFLSIIAHHGTIIADTKAEILEIVNKYIIVYRNYALLTHKIEKGLKAKRVENIFQEEK